MVGDTCLFDVDGVEGRLLPAERFDGVVTTSEMSLSFLDQSDCDFEAAMITLRRSTLVDSFQDLSERIFVTRGKRIEMPSDVDESIPAV